MKVIFKGGPHDGETDEIGPNVMRRVHYLSTKIIDYRTALPDYEYVHTDEVDDEGRIIYQFKDNR